MTSYMEALESETRQFLSQMCMPNPAYHCSFKEFQFVYNKWEEAKSGKKFAKAEALVEAMEKIFPANANSRVTIDKAQGKYFGMGIDLKKKDALLNEGEYGKNGNAGQFDSHNN